MRVLVHDYAGHPTAVHLSRELASRGHAVTHAWCSRLVSPRGELTRRPDDADSLKFLPIEPPYPIEKGHLFRRRLQEIAYGHRLARILDRVEPDVVLSANTPLDAQARLLRRARSRGVRFVFWVQDLLGVGTRNVLSRRLGLPGRWVGSHFVRLEAALLRGSDAVVAISGDFLPLLRDSGVPDDRIHVVENWAPFDEVPERPRDNPWARRQGLSRRVLLYSGTLGMKHNPALLLELARRFADDPEVQVVVVSEGTGAEWLAREQRRVAVGNLRMMGFQPFADLPDVLASADVLLAILERDSGIFSVPSKVLTALCARRPLLLSVPRENLAARIVRDNDAGLTVEPAESARLFEAAQRLLCDPALRARLGTNARRYAERAFDVRAKADRFEKILSPAR